MNDMLLSSKVTPQGAPGADGLPPTVATSYMEAVARKMKHRLIVIALVLTIGVAGVVVSAIAIRNFNNRNYQSSSQGKISFSMINTDSQPAPHRRSLKAPNVRPHHAAYV